MKTLIAVVLALAVPVAQAAIEYRHCDVRMDYDNGFKDKVLQDAVRVVDHGASYVVYGARGKVNHSGPMISTTLVDGVRIEHSAPHPDTGMVFARSDKKVPGYRQSYAVWMEGGLLQMLCN